MQSKYKNCSKINAPGLSFFSSENILKKHLWFEC